MYVQFYLHYPDNNQFENGNKKGPGLSGHINGQVSAISTTRLIRGGMLSMKGQSHVLHHMMTLR